MKGTIQISKSGLDVILKQLEEIVCQNIRGEHWDHDLDESLVKARVTDTLLDDLTDAVFTVGQLDDTNPPLKDVCVSRSNGGLRIQYETAWGGKPYISLDNVIFYDHSMSSSIREITNNYFSEVAA